MNISKNIATAILLIASASAFGQQATSTRTVAENLMREHPPRLHFDAGKMSADSFPLWQAGMRSAMAALMKHPKSPVRDATKISSILTDGYRLERWLSYPLEGAVVPFSVMIPDGVDADNPAPAVLCIPGSGQTMAQLIGENGMGRNFVDMELIAVVVDNPSSGELSDGGVFDYTTSARFLLEMGWSWLGLASWQDKVILDWMKTRSDIRADRIIVSGFSLGTEPLMVLGLLDESIYAFVYNDFLCRTRERALTMNKPDANGVRSYPNNIRHLIPGFLTEFDFPDIVAALAPRPVICTEGGMDRDFEIVKSAYDLAGAPENFTFYHYEKYADPADRVYLQAMPEGIDRDTFFRLANVDPANHYFKSEVIIPWLTSLLSHGEAE